MPKKQAGQPARPGLEPVPIIDSMGRATRVWKRGQTPTERKRPTIPPTPLLPQLAEVLEPLKEYGQELQEIQRMLVEAPSLAPFVLGAFKTAETAVEVMRKARDINHPLNIDLSRNLFARLADVELHGSFDPRKWRESASRTAQNFKSAFAGPEIHRGAVNPAQLTVLDQGADQLAFDSQAAVLRNDLEAAALYAVVSDHIVDLALQDEPLKVAKRYADAYRPSQLPPEASEELAAAFQLARERLLGLTRALNAARKA